MISHPHRKACGSVDFFSDKPSLSLFLFLGLICFILLFRSLGSAGGTESSFNGKFDGSTNGTYDNFSVDIQIPYTDLEKFLVMDRTWLHHYNQTYKCLNFSQDMIRNATREGFDCDLVLLINGSYSHAIVVFNLPEKMVYVEPQKNRIISLSGYHFDSMIVYDGIQNPYFSIE